MKRKIRCCAFDSDGVLTNTARCHFNAWCKLATELGITLPAEFEPELSGISRMNALKRVLEYGGILAEFTGPELKALTDQKNSYYQEEIQNLTSTVILPHIPSLLDELKNHEIKIIVASGSANTPKVLQSVGLLSKFDGIVDPTVIPGKPAPDIFAKAAQIAGVAPNECIGIEDSLAGTQAIKKAGMIAISIGKQTKFEGESDFVVPNTNALNYQLFKDIFNRVQQQSEIYEY